MNESKSITVETTVNAPIEAVWERWNLPEHVTQWAFASDEWEAPSAENNLSVGGRFKTRMQAKDGSAGFDFEGAYTVVEKNARIEYDMDDERHVTVEFTAVPEGTHVKETFQMENENPEEMQRAGWQAILENFKKYAERA